jgi:S-DNA-T family DNA segregation ATPase FtsK/SpoIIIE
VGGGAERAWDAVAELSEHAPEPGSLLLIDDLDALGATLPQDYARELLERLERVVRGAGETEILVVAAAQRLSGGATRIAELLPRRLVLAASSRAEHIAAGGDPAHYAPASPPGRGRLDGRSVQVAMTAPADEPRAEPPAPWHPLGALTGFAVRRSPAARAAIAVWEREGARVLSLEEFSGWGEWGTGAPVVVTGDAEEWQRHWRALGTIRSDHDLVVDASCGPEFRMLTGERSLPPYCLPGRARAWLLRAGGGAARITLPESP